MGLDRPALEQKIKEAFKKAKETPPPADPADSDKVQEKILEQLSLDLSNAIDAFVKSGDVAGITTEVKDMTNTNLIGHGAQQGSVHIS